ncbi:MAG TPA: biotin-dependent carboxyltransferase family protein [Chitinophagaceae bacterium]|nr:biotin-dependent carboxyltransferase family protein [Chitinophagaceae bacterium]
MSITIFKAGILDSLQDGGRYGYAAQGINPGGVMDSFAADTANFLVGNSNHEAVLELHFPASQLFFKEDALIAVCGADLTPTVNNEAIPMWQPVMVKRNTLLQFLKWNWGARVYVAVQGGFKVQQWLNSYSTNLKAAAGGHSGRMLAKGDVLPLRNTSEIIAKTIPADKDHLALPWGVLDKRIYDQPEQILILPGPEWMLLDNASKVALTTAAFTIDQRSDRMGSLLNGPSLQLQEPMEMVSSGVDFGTIQLLPEGRLMILMADHQTTGGYPRIGSVITAHLPKLAQLLPGSSICFNLTDIAAAEQMLFSQMRDNSIIERSCRDHLTELYARH